MSIITTIHSAAQAWDLARDLQAMQDWSYPAFRAMFNYMEELSAELGEQMEFDPVGWASEYSYWESAAACYEDCYEDQYADLVAKNEKNEGDGDSLERLCFNYLAHHATIVYSNGPRGLVIRDS